MPEIHFLGERLPGVKAAVEMAFTGGFEAGLGQGFQGGLSVGILLGVTATAIIAIVLIFALLRFTSRPRSSP
jgi:chromate transport protein ChrA